MQLKRILTSRRTVLFLVLMAATALLSACALQSDVTLSHSSPAATSESQETLLLGEEVVIGLLLVSIVVSLITQRLRIPYTVGLVLMGLGLTFFGRVPFLTLAPDLILAILVPPLVFEAAFHIRLNDLRHDLGLILLLAVPGVVLTTVLVGGVVALGAQIPLNVALVFGALIAATDPVAVVALFRALGVPKRLQVLLESESLLNDGTAIVLFTLTLSVALTGQFSLAGSLVNFVVVAGGGVLTGFIVGLVGSRLTSQINAHLIETALTTVVAYGAYLIAEGVLHVSGVLAVVTAGLMMGNMGPRGMSPTTRIVVFNFWEFAAFLANSLVFLLVGLQMETQLMLDNIQAIFVAILAVLAARVVSVYGLSRFGKIPTAWQHVLFWGGLRGAISLALALSLPEGLGYQSQLQAMAFGVVLFTIIVEGLSMPRLAKAAGLVQKQEERINYERVTARSIAIQAAQSHLKAMNHERSVSDYAWTTLQPLLEQQMIEVTENARIILHENPSLRQKELDQAWNESLRTQRTALVDLLRKNVITEEVFYELVSEVDEALEDPDSLKRALGQVAD